MATISVTVPDPGPLAVTLGKALARAMGEAEPTTNAQRVDLAQRFMKAKAKEALIEYRAQEAAVASRSDNSDGALSW